MSTDTKTFDNAANFTYPSEMEITSDLHLKPIAYANEIFFAPYDNGYGLDAARSDGSATGTENGTITVSGGKAQLEANEWIGYDVTGNADLTNVGCIEIEAEFAFTGTPSSNVNILTIGETGGSLNNLIYFSLTSGGALTVSIRDSVGSGVVNIITGWTPTSGVKYHFSINFDISSGATRLFVDGTQLGTTYTGTGTRVAATNFEVGRYCVNGTKNNDEFSVHSLRVFDAVQRTTDFTPPSSEPATYAKATEAYCIVKSGTYNDDIDSLSFTNLVVPSNTQAGFILEHDGAKYYYDGSSWVASDGSLSQSNTSADIIANSPSFDTLPGGETKIGVIFYSNDGWDTPTLDSYTLTYNYFGAAGTIATCIIWGNLWDNDNPEASESVTIESIGPVVRDGNLISVNEPLTTRSNGYFEIAVPDDHDYIIKAVWYDQQGKRQTYEAKLTVPSGATTKKFSEIVST